MTTALEDTMWNRLCVEDIRTGMCRGVSIEWKILADRWEQGVDGRPLHVVEKAKILDVALAANPAYPGADVLIGG